MAINSSIIDNPIISITNQINQYKIVLMFYNASRLCEARPNSERQPLLTDKCLCDAQSIKIRQRVSYSRC